MRMILGELVFVLLLFAGAGFLGLLVFGLKGPRRK
jgi:hypothetical protein